MGLSWKPKCQIGSKVKLFIIIILNLLSFNVLAGEINVTIGEKKVLLKSGSFGLDYFPDEKVSILSKKPNFRMIVAAGARSYLLEGKDIEHITGAKLILSPGKAGSFDNGYAGISGIYYYTDKRWYAIYHAEDQENMPKLPSGVKGFYARIGMAVSSDDGNTWEKIGSVISSFKPKEWAINDRHADRGAAVPCLVKEKSGRYLYIYYTDHSRVDNLGIQISMARADISKEPPLPGNWFKYFQGDFTQPGLAGSDTPIVSARQFGLADALSPDVVYSKYLDKYVMVFTIDAWKELASKDELKYTGIYLTYSEDGIHWNEPQRIITDHTLPHIGYSLSWVPTIVWDDEQGIEGWLVYSYSPSWGHKWNKSGTPHFMVGSRIKFDQKIIQ